MFYFEDRKLCLLFFPFEEPVPSVRNRNQRNFLYQDAFGAAVAANKMCSKYKTARKPLR